MAEKKHLFDSNNEKEEKLALLLLLLMVVAVAFTPTTFGHVNDVVVPAGTNAAEVVKATAEEDVKGDRRIRCISEFCEEREGEKKELILPTITLAPSVLLKMCQWGIV